METGIEKLKSAVMRDCANGENCFSENGCTKTRHLYIPQDNPALIEMGFKTKCVANTKCQHDYCGKFKWILDRADHYAENTGMTRDEVINAWENNRTYWYMNYYQDIKQPLIISDKVIRYDDWIADLKSKFGENPVNWKFKCAACGNVQSAKDFKENNLIEEADKVYFNCIGRYVSNKGCDWTLGGMMQIHKIAVLKDGVVFPVFETADGGES